MAHSAIEFLEKMLLSIVDKFKENNIEAYGIDDIATYHLVKDNEFSKYLLSLFYRQPIDLHILVNEGGDILEDVSESCGLVPVSSASQVEEGLLVCFIPKTSYSVRLISDYKKAGFITKPSPASDKYTLSPTDIFISRILQVEPSYQDLMECAGLIFKFYPSSNEVDRISVGRLRVIASNKNYYDRIMKNTNTLTFLLNKLVKEEYRDNFDKLSRLISSLRKRIK